MDGLYVVTEYADGNASSSVDEVNHNRNAETVDGRYAAPMLTFERSGLTNDWLSPLDAAELGLDRNELTGQLVHLYLITEWPVAGSPDPFTTRLEVPVSLRLERAPMSPAN